MFAPQELKILKMIPISLSINGKKLETLIHEHEMLSSVIRNRAGLTGTKEGCEQGSCGACTVLVDGRPVLSCITPAKRCDGASILTIEGVASNGKLHKLQEKFVQKGAIQCGFCTPGMVMTVLAFTNQNPNPTIEEIKEAISGNICRCTGYKKIVEAIAEYCNSDAGAIHESPLQDGFQHVGIPRPYVDAVKKVKGEAEFADDIRIKDTLYCKFVRSKYPHAKIKSIDASAAENLPGVRAVITGKDLPVKFGVLPISEDETAMAVEKVRFAGEIVAAVAADSEEIAAEVCKLIKVQYIPLKPFLTIEDSLLPVAEDEKIHSHTKYNNNVHKVAELRFGDQRAGLAESEVKCRMEFQFAGLNHAFTEPHAAAAFWDENGLTIYSATQVPHYLHRYLSQVLEVPMNRIRVIKPFLGGGFGGKSDPFPHELIIAHLARITGKPVKVRLTREEVFLTNHGRHPTRMALEIGTDTQGNFKVLDADIAIDGGAYGSFGVVTSYYNGVLLQLPYKLDNFGFISRRVYTNKPQCGAMRGHGGVNPRFAVECLIDQLARMLNMDPCELRLKNFLKSNVITLGQFRVTSNGVAECLKAVMEKSRWKERWGKLEYGHGLGVACGAYISGSALPIHRSEYPQSVVHLKVDLDGRVVIFSGASDIGQGSDTMLAVIVSEVLGIGLDNVYVHAADTLLSPIDLGSYSSRVTFMAGNAAKMAAEKLKKKILNAVAANFELGTPVETRASSGGVSNSDVLSIAQERVFSNDGRVNLSWREAIEISTRKVGALNSSGYYNSPKLGGTFKGAGAGLSPSYSFGAVIAEVKVNPETGKVNVLKLWGAHDAGRALNPLAVEGQLEGSWVMGLGQTLGEEMRYHEGLLLNGNFIDYKVPTAADIPEIDTTIIESIDPEGPFGAKECGEGALHPTNPAIANAIYDAVGVRITRLPVREEEILKEIKKSEKCHSESRAIGTKNLIFD
jgi:4-hydroxybenzoyl-CoA reductase subunit alpha